MPTLKIFAILFIGFWFGSMSAQPNQATKHKDEPAEQCSTPAHSVDSHNNYNYPERATNQANKQSPSGVDTVKWTEVWLVRLEFATLIFIGWQAFETSRSTRAALRNIIHQFRPRIKIRGIHLVDAEKLALEIILVNTGGTPAKVIEAKFTLSLKWEYGGFEPTDISDTVHRDFAIIPGDDLITTIDITEQRMLLGMSSNGQDRAVPLQCQGVVKYTDENGTTRKTGFLRSYSIRSKRFEIISDPEFEYED